MESPIKRAAPDSGSSSIQNVLLGGSDKINNITPVTLDEDQIERIVQVLSPNAKQQHRFVGYLGRNPLSRTKVCCRAIACVNLSNLRERTSSALSKFGLEARCTHPEKPIKNAFGESTDERLWAIYKIEGWVL